MSRLHRSTDLMSLSKGTLDSEETIVQLEADIDAVTTVETLKPTIVAIIDRVNMLMERMSEFQVCLDDAVEYSESETKLRESTFATVRAELEEVNERGYFRDPSRKY